MDIGVHQDGLVHISQMSDRFIKHPLEVVSVGDIVEVKVLDVDLKKQRIALTMKINRLTDQKKHAYNRERKIILILRGRVMQ